MAKAKNEPDVVRYAARQGPKIELLENSKGIFFDSGMPAPSDSGKQVLQKLSKEIGKIPNRVSIEGHTDSTPYGSDTYTNWNLSSDRANEARKLMGGSGLAPNQVSQIRGFADQALRNIKNPTDPANRRVSLIIQYGGQAPLLEQLPDMSLKKQLPGPALAGEHVSAPTEGPAERPKAAGGESKAGKK